MAGRDAAFFILGFGSGVYSYISTECKTFTWCEERQLVSPLSNYSSRNRVDNMPNQPNFQNGVSLFPIPYEKL